MIYFNYVGGSLTIIFLLLLFKITHQNDYIFDKPDLVVNYIDPITLNPIQLEAFKSTLNEKIIEEKLENAYSQLKWVSIGLPRLLANKYCNESTKLIQTIENNDTLSLKIELLTEEHRLKFKDHVKLKYNVSIDIEQVNNLDLSKFECSLAFYDKNLTEYLIGHVENLKKYPLKINFKITRQLDLIREKLANDHLKHLNVMRMNCMIRNSEMLVKRKIFKLNINILKQLNVLDQLFSNENSSTVYVTKKQLNMLADEIYEKFEIKTRFLMTNEIFKEIFVFDFLNQTTTPPNHIAFNYVNYSDSELLLSNYGNLKLILENEINSSIVVDNFTNLTTTTTLTGYNSNASSLNNDQIDLFSSSPMSLINQQLDQLNQNQQEIKWQIADSKIIPASINVIKLEKFNRDLLFDRVYQITNDSTFKSYFKMNTKTFTSINMCQEVERQANQLKEIDNQSSNIIESSFEIAQGSN